MLAIVIQTTSGNANYISYARDARRKKEKNLPQSIHSLDG